MLVEKSLGTPKPFIGSFHFNGNQFWLFTSTKKLKLALSWSFFNSPFLCLLSAERNNRVPCFAAAAAALPFHFSPLLLHNFIIFFFFTLPPPPPPKKTNDDVDDVQSLSTRRKSSSSRRSVPLWSKKEPKNAPRTFLQRRSVKLGRLPDNLISILWSQVQFPASKMWTRAKRWNRKRLFFRDFRIPSDAWLCKSIFTPNFKTMWKVSESSSGILFGENLPEKHCAGTVAQFVERCSWDTGSNPGCSKFVWMCFSFRLVWVRDNWLRTFEVHSCDNFCINIQSTTLQLSLGSRRPMQLLWHWGDTKPNCTFY